MEVILYDFIRFILVKGILLRFIYKCIICNMREILKYIFFVFCDVEELFFVLGLLS